jgi:hypothetical protein
MSRKPLRRRIVEPSFTCSKRRFQAACDRAKLFQDDPQAFFREKKFRAGGAAAPRAAPSFPDV